MLQSCPLLPGPVVDIATMIHSALYRRSLVHTTSLIASTQSLGSHLTRSRQVLSVATNLTHTRYYGAFRASRPALRRAKNAVDLDQKALGSIPGAVGKPKRSILSLDDLQAVNPNPTIPVVTASKELATPPTVPKVNPERKSKRKRKGKDKDKEVTATLSPVSDDIPATPILQKEAAVLAPPPKKRLTPLRKQILELEATYPDCVLLIRVGEFYEVRSDENV